MPPQTIFAFVNYLWEKVIYLTDLKMALVLYLYLLYSLYELSQK